MQRPAGRLRYPLLAALAVIVGCVTVNIYFPAAKVEKTAEEFVGDVYQEKTEPAPPAETEKPQSLNERGVRAGLALLEWLGPAPASAAEEATTVSNAAIRGLKEQIARRHQELRPYYQSGQVGINKDGFLEVRSTAGLPLPQVAGLKRLVDADNAARRQLYDEVVKALGLQPGQVDQVRKIFAKQWRNQGQPGWWMQTDDGQWVQK